MASENVTKLINENFSSNDLLTAFLYHEIKFRIDPESGIDVLFELVDLEKIPQQELDEEILSMAEEMASSTLEDVIDYDAFDNKLKDEFSDTFSKYLIEK